MDTAVTPHPTTFSFSALRAELRSVALRTPPAGGVKGKALRRAGSSRPTGTRGDHGGRPYGWCASAIHLIRHALHANFSFSALRAELCSAVLRTPPAGGIREKALASFRPGIGGRRWEVRRQCPRQSGLPM